MRKWRTTCALAAAVVLCSAGANAAIYTGAMVFQGVEKYTKDIANPTKRDIDPGAAMMMGYIFGVADADQGVCPDPRLSAANFMVVVDSYLKLHQDQLDKNAAVLVSAALREAYPCHRNK